MATEVIAALTSRAHGADGKPEIKKLLSEVGHALALNHLTASELSALRRTVSRRRRSERNEFNAGLWEATASLLSSAEAALQDTEARTTLQRDAETRAGWTPLLLALQQRPHAPSELASVLDPGRSKDNGRVSRCLKEMQEAGLVEAAPAGSDARVRRRQLTARGYRIASMLEQAASAQSAHPEPPSEQETAARVVSMLRLVHQSASVGLSELTACAGPRGVSSDRFTREVVRMAEMRGLVDLRADETIVWGRQERRGSWEKVLASSASASEVSKAFASIPPGFLLCTDTETVDVWRHVLSTAGVHAKEVCTTALAEKVAADFSAVVFDDPTLQRDLWRGKRIHQYVATPNGSSSLRLSPAPMHHGKASVVR